MSPLCRDEIDGMAHLVFEACTHEEYEAALHALRPILDRKCHFSTLDLLGKRIGQMGVDEHETFFKAFDKIIQYNAMGSYVIVSQALIWFLPSHLEFVMRKSREYIITGDVWYVCDIIGERSLGYAVVDNFDEMLPWLERFLDDENRWVRRSAGVAIHFFSKRVVDQPGKTTKLLHVLAPHLAEKRIEAVKGIGWGLKTIGKHHPDLLVTFLASQSEKKRKISRLLIRKAVTYLEEEKKKEVEALFL
ncbi:MAG: DNA alkylation repair protein [Theionarchaea archaeon]|nr:DNA alkylation repair protein [Theionarchaea archaeon]MBU7000732.1 DNA alkylation repair protein [Theionarchaea archaeon]MBU7021485.1 DNA alkylation repair protein [Theionarchaea archaeon]MBU7033574.1 DNA alkylation repair protein [Theionarchaea archaeon]MBU7039616.1 DNA alkylation repair protein [Theionarchaea archaeon]